MPARYCGGLSSRCSPCSPGQPQYHTSDPLLHSLQPGGGAKSPSRDRRNRLFLSLRCSWAGANDQCVVNLRNENMSAPLWPIRRNVVVRLISGSLSPRCWYGLPADRRSTGRRARNVIGSSSGIKMSESGKVWSGRIAAIVIGVVAIFLGNGFEGMNVSFLVGWAFAVAASANLPAIIMLLFWKKTTAQGIVASILVGIVSSVGLILLSPDMFTRYGLLPSQAPIPLTMPAIFSIR